MVAPNWLRRVVFCWRPELGSIRNKQIIWWQHLSRIKARLFWQDENVSSPIKMQQATSGTSAATYKMMEPHSYLSITDDNSPTAKKETQQLRTKTYIIQRNKPMVVSCQVPKKEVRGQTCQIYFPRPRNSICKNSSKAALKVHQNFNT